jgi:catechol 2,3-dioxygenase-like lactoylglutathione lyase family enzyme
MDRNDLDSAELKFVVPAGEERVALDALGLDLRKGSSGRVFYLDTPELDLLSRGVVLRGRRRAGGDQDIAVKVRSEIAPRLARGPAAGDGLTVELDVMPGVSVCTATLKRHCAKGTLEGALAGERPLRKLFSKRQRALICECLEIDWPSVRVLGPVDVLKATTRVPGLNAGVVAELWGYPDRSSLLELSTRVRPRDLPEQSIRFWRLIEQLGFDVRERQETKSTRSLALLARAADRPSSRNAGEPVAAVDHAIAVRASACDALLRENEGTRMSLQINHVSINARNLQESVDFYVDLVGAEPIATPNFGLPVQWLALGRTQLHLFERDLKPTSHHHFGVTVDDVEPVYRAAERRGAFDDEAFGNRLVELPGDVVQLYVRDPAGNLVEFDQVGADRLPDDLRAQLRPLWEFHPHTEEQMSARLFVPE